MVMIQKDILKKQRRKRSHCFPIYIVKVSWVITAVMESSQPSPDFETAVKNKDKLH